MMVMATIERVSESRRSHRRRLRLSTSAAAHTKGNVAIVVRDLSTTGVLFASRASFSVGEQLRIMLPQDVVATATIVWGRGGLYGCALDTPLSSAAVSAALLKGEPDSAVHAGYEVSQPSEQWPRPVRIALIVAGAALVWVLIGLAVVGLL